jgi:hypothetical protein
VAAPRRRCFGLRECRGKADGGDPDPGHHEADEPTGVKVAMPSTSATQPITRRKPSRGDHPGRADEQEDDAAVREEPLSLQASPFLVGGISPGRSADVPSGHIGAGMETTPALAPIPACDEDR